MKKYYSILSTTPDRDLHKFYKEESSFAHGEGRSAATSSPPRHHPSWTVVRETRARMTRTFIQTPSLLIHDCVAVRAGATPELSVSGLENIQRRITELNFEETVVNLECGTIESQQSKDGTFGVLVWWWWWDGRE